MTRIPSNRTQQPYPRHGRRVLRLPLHRCPLSVTNHVHSLFTFAVSDRRPSRPPGARVFQHDAGVPAAFAYLTSAADRSGDGYSLKYQIVILYHYLIQNSRFCAEAQGSPGIGRRTGPRASRAPQGMPPGYFKRSIDKSTAVTVEKSFQCRHVKVKRTFRSEMGPFLVATRVAGIGCRGARERRALQGVENLYGGNCRRP